MTCEHCGKKVPLLRILTDSQYCCEDHRWIHLEEMNRLGLALLMRQARGAHVVTHSSDLPPAAEFFSSGRTPRASEPFASTGAEARAVRSYRVV